MVSSLRRHMKRTHVIVLPQIRGVDVGRGGPETHRVSFPRVLKSVACSVDGCPPRKNNPGRIREHFIYRHWKSNVILIQEGPEPLPRCDHRGMYMPEARLFKHIQTDICNKLTEMRIRRRDVEMV